MKRIITLLGIIASVSALSDNAKAQTITSTNYYDSCNYMMGSSVNAMIQLSSPTSLSACKVETSWGDGSKDSSNIGSAGGTNYNSYSWGHTYATTGTYTIKHVLICGSSRLDSLNSSYLVSCSFIGGALYHDANSNCIFNATENQTHGIAKIEIDSAGVKIDTIYGYGHWWYRPRATTSTVYKFKLLSSPTGFTNTCPSSGIITLTYVPTLTAITGNDFAFNCSSTPAYDYSLSYTRQLRGASSTGVSFINLLASNTSCHTGTSTVTLNVSPKYNITTSGITPTPASVTGNTVVWTISGLSYGYTLLHVPLTPKSTTSNGDTACNNANIMPTTGDPNVANNFVSVCDSVRASWDPNEKSVSPNGPVSAGTLLSYTIDFENLGNDTAFNIHVQDTLSQHLDPRTFELLASTHRVLPEVYEIPGGKYILKFDFPGINLEDKTVPERNKGQVRFSMKMKSGLPFGTVVENRAGIYFDGNPVVLTNSAYSRIPVPSGVNPVNQISGIQVYPNPATDVISIRVQQEGWKEAILTNAVGQTVSHIELTVGENVLHVQNLPAGIYYLQAKGSNGIFTGKVEKL